MIYLINLSIAGIEITFSSMISPVFFFSFLRVFHFLCVYEMYFILSRFLSLLFDFFWGRSAFEVLNL